MSLLAEELVEEWLNRQGYFTIRGLKLGNDEMDILAIRYKSGDVECRHIEVQASIDPVSYISKVPKEIQKEGRIANSAKKRSDEELRLGIREWLDKKFNLAKKQRKLQELVPKAWSHELVIHKVKHSREIDLFREVDKNLVIHSLTDVVAELKKNKSTNKAAGSHLIDLINITND